MRPIAVLRPLPPAKLRAEFITRMLQEWTRFRFLLPITERRDPGVQVSVVGELGGVGDKLPVRRPVRRKLRTLCVEHASGRPPLSARRKRPMRRSSPRLNRISPPSQAQTAVSSATARSASVIRKTAPSRSRSITQIVGWVVSGSSCLCTARYLSSGESLIERKSLGSPAAEMDLPCRSNHVSWRFSAQPA
jgi:hypothetical protein